MTAQPKPYITEAEYLELERTSASKHEYVAGEIFAMTGASEQHNLIASNVTATLHRIEILSPSAERYDRGLKFQNYRTIPSLQEYILIAQDTQHIERYTRHEEKQWILSEALGAEASIQIASLSIALALTDVYKQVELPATPESPLSGDMPIES